MYCEANFTFDLVIHVPICLGDWTGRDGPILYGKGGESMKCPNRVACYYRKPH